MERLTFEEFMLCLPDDVLHKYLVNLFKENFRDDKILIILNRLNTYESWIGGYFTWMTSDEGQDFWNYVHNKDYEKIAKHEF